MRTLLTTLLLIVASAQGFAKTAQDLNQSFDSLGGNEDLVKRAKALDPKNRVQVVQKRTVDRYNRVEFGVNGGMVAGGDPYLSTYNLGANLDYHITPRWSLGARYYHSLNDLTSEGKNMYDEALKKARTGGDYTITEIDYPIDSMMAVVSWYPIYGKMNMFNSGIAQFDLYTLAGYGKMHLSSGYTDAFTAGGGVGLWLSQHWTTRFEVRWHGYKDQNYLGSRQLNLTIATFSIGFLL